MATVLEQHFADLAERRPELLAHHLTGAGEVEPAGAQWLQAGRFAAARLAHREAIRHFDRGLALLGSMPEGSARDGHETELLLGRGLSLFTTEGFSSTAAAQGYERASELAERRHDARQLFMAVYGQWQSNAVFAPSTRPVKSSGCWAIPTQRWPAAERVWRWRSVSRTRSACYWS